MRTPAQGPNGGKWLYFADPAETDTLRVLVVQDFKGVAVEDVNNLANTGAPDNAGNVQYCGAWEGLSRRSRREQ